MGLLVSFVSPLSHENGVHARRRPNGGYANPAEPAIGREPERQPEPPFAPGTPSSCAEGDASRGAGRAGRGRLAVWAAFAGINASICCHQRRESGSGMRSRRVGQPSVVNPSLRHTSRLCASRRAAQTPDKDNTNKTNDHERLLTPN